MMRTLTHAGKNNKKGAMNRSHPLTYRSNTSLIMTTDRIPQVNSENEMYFASLTSLNMIACAEGSFLHILTENEKVQYQLKMNTFGGLDGSESFESKDICAYSNNSKPVYI